MTAPAAFVVGVPRSGTTLLRLMLDAHAELAIGPETHFLPQLFATDTNGSEPLSDMCRRVIVGSPRWPDFELSTDQLESAYRANPPQSTSDAVRVFYRLYAGRFGKTRWGDKTPGYAVHMTSIYAHLPEARFVHIIRDGRDVALSICPLWFGPNTIEDAARWWRTRITAARRQSTLLPHYLEVRFEDLVTATEMTLRRICDFLELEWSPSLLQHASTAHDRLSELNRPVFAPDGRRVAARERLTMHAKALTEADSSNVERWRRGMTSQEAKAFASAAGDILLELGYPSD